MNKEKRKSQRYPLVDKVVITTNDNREIMAHLTDISFAGKGACSADRIDEATNIMMRVMFTNSRGGEQEVTIDGIVLWVAEEGKVYEMGSRFSQYLGHHI